MITTVFDKETIAKLQKIIWNSELLKLTEIYFCYLYINLFFRPTNWDSYVLLNVLKTEQNLIKKCVEPTVVNVQNEKPTVFHCFNNRKDT